MDGVEGDLMWHLGAGEARMQPGFERVGGQCRVGGEFYFGMKDCPELEMGC